MKALSAQNTRPKSSFIPGIKTRKEFQGAAAFASWSPSQRHAHVAPLLRANDFGVSLNAEQRNKNLPPINSIPLSRGLVDQHFLKKTILSKSPLSIKDFEELNESDSINLKFHEEKPGILVASSGMSHGKGIWTRDAMTVALGSIAIGDYDLATRIVNAFLDAYNHKTQKDRINAFAYPHTHPSLNKNPSRLWKQWGKHFPQIKFSIGTEHLININHSWEHRQFDAHGYFLTALMKLIKANKIDPGLIKAKPFEEPIFMGIARMLINVKFWENTKDAGAWEYPLHAQLSSSIAACVSGLELLKREIEKPHGPGFHIDQPEKFKTELNNALAEARKVLFARIEKDSVPELSSDFNHGKSRDDGRLQRNRELDSALVLSLVLSDSEAIGLNRNQEDKILRTIYKLMGEIGFKRFLTDEYMGENWTTKKHDKTKYKEHSYNRDKKFVAAEWCLVDPYLAKFFYQRYIKSGGIDLDSFYRADIHSRRALVQVSGRDMSFHRKAYKGGPGNELKSQLAKIPRGEAMEHYWLSTRDLYSGKKRHNKEQLWQAGENYGLNWTKIALKQMLHFGKQAASVYETKNGIIPTPEYTRQTADHTQIPLREAS